MHGLWFVLLQEFVNDKNPPGYWKKLLQMAGLPATNLYFNNKDYPDEEFGKLVVEFCQATGQSRDEFFLRLGKHFGEYFFKNYTQFIDPSWTSIDMIEQWPYYFYIILKAPDPEHQTGNIRSERKDKDHVVIYYQSPRHLCSMMEGASHAVFEHFKEKGHMDHLHCMKKGDPYCELSFERGRERVDASSSERK